MLIFLQKSKVIIFQKIIILTLQLKQFSRSINKLLKEVSSTNRLLDNLYTNPMTQTPFLINLKQQTKQQLQSITKQKLQKMFQDKKQTPSLIIPKNLLNFVKTQSYKKFSQLIYQYCKQYNQLTKKYVQLKQKMKTRVDDYAFFLQKQKQNLVAMQKQLSYIYAGILLMGHDGNSHHKDQKQQFFFQTLIYLITKVVRQFFTREEFGLLEEEINRLFRTNRFNLIKRRHQNDSLMKQFPILKQPTNKQKLTLQAIINKVPQQISAFKKIQKINKAKSLKQVQGGQNDYTTLMGIQQVRDDQQRSPLICSWLPSRKNMLSQFSRMKYSNHLKMSSNNNNYDKTSKSKTLSKVYENTLNTIVNNDQLGD